MTMGSPPAIRTTVVLAPCSLIVAMAILPSRRLLGRSVTIRLVLPVRILLTPRAPHFIQPTHSAHAPLPLNLLTRKPLLTPATVPMPTLLIATIVLTSALPDPRLTIIFPTRRVYAGTSVVESNFNITTFSPVPTIHTARPWP